MWLYVMRRWVRYRLAFQMLFFSVVALGMYLGMHPSPPRTAYGFVAPLYHAGGLFGCTILSYLAYPRWRWWFRGLMMFLVGVSIELVQSLHPTRSADMNDIIVNSVGIAAGLLVVLLWERYGKWHPHRRVGQ